jgi:PAS domain S-box-containing protein
MSTSSSDRLAPQDAPSPASSPPPLDKAQLTALFAGVSEAVYIEELKSRRIVYWSPRATALFGYDAAQVMQQSAARLFADKDDVDPATELASAGCWRGRRRYRRANGDFFEAAVSATLWRSAPGTYVVHVVSVASGPDQSAAPRFEDWASPQMFEMLNQTEQLQTGTERRQGERMIGQLLRNVVNDALFTTDHNGYIVDWNKAATGLLGYDRADVCGKHFSIVCAEGEERSASDQLHQAAEHGTTRYNQWMARKDGKRVYASVAAFALWGEAHPQGFLFLVRDDSRERSFRQKVREREQMAAIGTAASMLAHEIGNPLNGISATVQLLEHFVSRANLPAVQSILSSIHDLKSEIQRLTTLLNEFKNIAWPQKLALAPVDVSGLIQTLVDLLAKRASRQKIEIAVDCQPGLPLLDGDAEKLKEALLHVLDNAVEAMPHGGTLEIKAYQCDEAICIDIIDSGVGIPENFKVFDLFSSTKPHGTGFGLFVVQQIVLAHDGTITYSSTPGHGTTFHLSFTLHPSPESFGDEIVEAP